MQKEEESIGRLRPFCPPTTKETKCTTNVHKAYAIAIGLLDFAFLKPFFKLIIK
jgi:hypothetical protein